MTPYLLAVLALLLLIVFVEKFKKPKYICLDLGGGNVTFYKLETKIKLLRSQRPERAEITYYRLEEGKWVEE